tara:strand:- start:105 stop:536 length:432 start_codon:yes stop_codon:yes gene_type:complete
MTEIKKKVVSLKTLLTPSKTVTIDYPEFEGFSVDLCYLSREELLKLRSRSVSQKLNKKSRAFEEVLDQDKFLVEYVNAVIKNWKGLKFKYLEKLLLADVSDLDPEGVLEFTKENAEVMMKNSADFDAWVSETVGDLENFTQSK